MKTFCIVIFALLLANTSFAVCLEGNPSIPEEYTESIAVVIGKVVSIEAVPETKEYYDGHNYILNVQEVLKGASVDTITIFSENSSGRFPMTEGSTYILFVYKELGRFQVSNCGNSGLLSEKEDVANAVRELIKNKNN